MQRLENRKPAGEPVRLRQNAARTRGAKVSPDDALMAYEQSGITGESRNVFLSRLPDGTGQWPVSVGEGSRPAWNAATRSLFFTHGSDVMAVAITPGAEPVIGEPRRLLQLPASEAALLALQPFQISPDGRRLLTLQAVREAAPQRLVVIRNWPALLKKGTK